MRNSKQVKVGDLVLGGGAPVSVQSMLNKPSDDIQGNVQQAKDLCEAGCEIIRVAIPNKHAVKLVDTIKNEVPVPLVADIHFDYRLALECVEAGVDKIRINPGNIGGIDRVKQVANACKNKNIPIRIGVNSGSLDKEILGKYGSATPEAMVESALFHASLLEKVDFDDIVISLKSSDAKTTFRAYRLASLKCAYPLHLGVTEAGTERMGMLKSAAGIGGLLLSGIGDTIRISLTADPVKEVESGLDLLRAIDLRKDKIQIISCPTCGRAKIDIIRLTRQAEEMLSNVNKTLKVAIMGCAVNGPGEARDADIGIAGGDGCGVLIRKGEVLRKVPEDALLGELLKEIQGM